MRTKTAFAASAFLLSLILSGASADNLGWLALFIALMIVFGALTIVFDRQDAQVSDRGRGPLSLPGPNSPARCTPLQGSGSPLPGSVRRAGAPNKTKGLAPTKASPNSRTLEDRSNVWHHFSG